LKNWLKHRILDPLLSLLRLGMAPQRLAFCVAIAIVVCNIPILGVSTILCGLIALLFRLNLPAMQVVQASMAPTQVLLIIPFVRLGEWIMRSPHQAISIKEGFALISQGIWQAIIVLRDAIFHAALAWIIIAPLSIYVLQRVLTPIFKQMAAQIRKP
jgi:uncharacterized protein (DUF2062 family)